MGYIDKNDESIKIITKLTPYGKEKILTNGVDLIKYFRVGDSDANYLVSDILKVGMIPSNGDETSVSENVKINSLINHSNSLTKEKEIKEESIKVVSDKKETPFINQHIEGELININDSIKGNLFKSFNLPITKLEKILYLTNQQSGGFLKTVISKFKTDEILILPIKQENGNIINGKDVKIGLNMIDGGKWDLYSSFSSQFNDNDNKSFDEHPIIKKVFKNSVLLFSDNVRKPLGDNSKSWSSGHKAFKPFKLGGKKTYNFLHDEAIGFLSLDLGFVVITNRKIINSFKGDGNIEFKSFKNEVYQTINLLLDRNEFYTSNNSTFSIDDDVRITEFELLDENKEVIAYAKLNGTIIKRKYEKLSINVKIVV